MELLLYCCFGIVILVRGDDDNDDAGGGGCDGDGDGDGEYDNEDNGCKQCLRVSHRLQVGSSLLQFLRPLQMLQSSPKIHQRQCQYSNIYCLKMKKNNHTSLLASISPPTTNAS